MTDTSTEALLRRLRIAVEHDHRLQERRAIRRWQAATAVLAAMTLAASTAAGVLAAGTGSRGWLLSDHARPDTDHFYACPSKPLRLSFGHNQVSLSINGRSALSANAAGGGVTSLCTRTVATDGRINNHGVGDTRSSTSLTCGEPLTHGRYVLELRPLSDSHGHIVGTAVNAGWITDDRGASVFFIVMSATLQTHGSALGWWSTCQAT